MLTIHGFLWFACIVAGAGTGFQAFAAGKQAGMPSVWYFQNKNRAMAKVMAAIPTMKPTIHLVWVFSDW